MEFNSKLVRELTEIYGPTGREHKVSAYIAEHIKPYVDEFYIDTLGNLIAHKKGNGKKVMLSAHMDQLGMMIKQIDEDGFLRFAKLGSIKPFNLMDERIVFENGTEGVIICEKATDYNNITHDNLYIDLALPNKEQVLKKVSLGDVATTKAEFYENEYAVMTQCLDDRIGCMIVMEIAKLCTNNTNDLYYAFTVQEEVGCVGEKTVAYDVEPDLFVTFDVTGTGDDPRKMPNSNKIGGGACIKYKDAFVVVDYASVKLLKKLCDENGVLYQIEVTEAGGTDATSVQTNKRGVHSSAVTIPTRNIHSRNEIICKEDILNCIRLGVLLGQKTLRFGDETE